MNDTQIIIVGTILVPLFVALVGGFWTIYKKIEGKATVNDLDKVKADLEKEITDKNVIVTSTLKEVKKEEKENHLHQEKRLDEQKEEDTKIRERIAKLEEVDRQQEVRLESQNSDIKELKKEMQEGFKEINGKIDSLILSINSWQKEKSSN